MSVLREKECRSQESQVVNAEVSGFKFNIYCLEAGGCPAND